MTKEDISKGWLKDAIVTNSYLNKDDIRKAILKLSNFKDKLQSEYVEFDIENQYGDETVYHKKVKAVFLEDSFYIPMVEYIKC